MGEIWERGTELEDGKAEKKQKAAGSSEYIITHCLVAFTLYVLGWCEKNVNLQQKEAC
jgi:hypothetical protein